MFTVTELCDTLPNSLAHIALPFQVHKVGSVRISKVDLSCVAVTLIETRLLLVIIGFHSYHLFVWKSVDFCVTH